MTQHPTGYFFKEVIRSSEGRKCIIASSISGILSGSVLPFMVTEFLNAFRTSNPTRSGWILGCLLVLIGCVKKYQETILLATIARLKRQGREAMIDKIEHSPPMPGSDPIKTTTSRFLISQQTAFWLTTDGIVTLAVGFMSFMVVLVVSGVPWWVHLVMVVVVVIAVRSYRAVKNATLFKEAGDLESQVGDLLADLYESRNNPQVQPAIKRALLTASQKASEVRSASNRYTIKHFLDVRNATTTLMCCGAVLAACTTDNTSTAVLLVVFIFTVSSLISSIHSLAVNMENVETGASPMLHLISQIPKPALPSGFSKVCVDTNNLVIRYPGKDSAADTLVSITDLKLTAGGIYVFTGKNGMGKSSLFKALMGVADYEGDLHLWGHQARDWDCSKAVNSFQQNRIPLSVTIDEAFRDEQGWIDPDIRSYALWCVNAEDIDLSHIHSGLSGGQQQKVDLALTIYRSLVTAERVQLLILDEPTNNIDRESLALMRKRLCDFASQLAVRATMLIAIHEGSIQQALLELPRSQEVT